MAGIRVPMLKSRVSSLSSRFCDGYFTNSVRIGECLHVRPSLVLFGSNYHTHAPRNPNFASRITAGMFDSGCTSALSPSNYARSSFPMVTMTPVSGCHSYSSFFGGKGDDKGPEASGTGGRDVVGNSELVDKVKDVWQSVVDVANAGVQKAKEASDELTPHAQQIFDSHPYLKDVVVPVGGTMTATLLAWLVMPSVLKRLHQYSTRGSTALLSGSLFSVEVPYEKSVWSALEDPVRYLVTFMAFSQICFLVAPDAVASQFIVQAWKGAVVLSFVWFVHRWKTNLFARALAAPNVQLVDREKLLALDKVSSVGLFGVGVMALAEACGVAVQSIMTVGGIGGVATAFASKDILGNVLSGLSMQFSKPFSLGDTIKAGSIEGQVVEMGLTTTKLLNAEKFPVIVPNSMLSSQVIVNKSRAQWRAFLTKIPLHLDSVESIPQVTDNIKSMLSSYPKVFLGKEVPYCYLSFIDVSHAALTLGCNLKLMSKEERYSTEQDIILQSLKIIKQHGASLGSLQQDPLSQ